jgi:Ca2+-transporting ATPase
MIGILTLVDFYIGNKFFGLEVARTMAFVAIGMLELVHSFNIKSEESIFKVGIFENKYLIMSFILGTIVQTIVVLIPKLAEIFKLTNLNVMQWAITLIISFLPIPIMELQKYLSKTTNLKKQTESHFYFPSF